MAKSIRSNPVVIRPDTAIGNISAEEDDDFLFECFVDHPALSAARETTNGKMFVSARTGAGKTAIIRMLERQNRYTSSIVDLAGLSMDYVANSDIIRFLKSLEIDIDLFFQALWKHVLCIEYIRLRFKVHNESTSRGVFQTLTEIFRMDERRKAALKYLSDWEGRFFITMDENIKEVTSKFESKISGEFAGEIPKFNARAGYTRTLSGEKKAELVARAKKIVNSSQLAELNKVLDLLSDVEDDRKYPTHYYILIDKLDEKWVDDGIRFDLIRALIECLRTFNKVKNLKIVVAIREDVLERVIQETEHVGFQREKYDDYFLRVKWSKIQLTELVQKRINTLYKRKYTSENVTFHDVFKHKIGQKDPLDYLLERTLYRPRDLIAFVNECFRAAEGQTEITARTVRGAESRYSRVRMQALIQEWQVAFPSLEIAFRLLSNRRGRFTSADISTKEFLDDFVLEVDGSIHHESDPIKESVARYMRDGNISNLLNITRILLSLLYRIGAIGLKTSTGERHLYSFQDVPIINAESIDLETKVHIHPMLHGALNVVPEHHKT